jgi:hypothetical protein
MNYEPPFYYNARFYEFKTCLRMIVKKSILPFVISGETMDEIDFNNVNLKIIDAIGLHVSKYSELQCLLNWLGVNTSFIYVGEFSEATNLSDFFRHFRSSERNKIIINKIFDDVEELKNKD